MEIQQRERIGAGEKADREDEHETA